ncbi:unnamed protein product [Amoebophrya sp. A25]|nr:unnamed protein product [Amoebophrya sp. A25]|eukprot:GSA25T00025050001.1
MSFLPASSSAPSSARVDGGSEFVRFRQELRETVRNYNTYSRSAFLSFDGGSGGGASSSSSINGGEEAGRSRTPSASSSSSGQSSGTASSHDRASPPPLNIHIFGPQGSGKTSFIRTCFRALLGARNLPKQIRNLELELYRTDDGTSRYSVYPLTQTIRIHDTRGQREYSEEELEQMKLVLEGRALPEKVIQQRKRYWLMLREFWKSEAEMKKAFSRRVMRNQSTIESEPHFVFLVIDPNQQELLFEDEDFRESYTALLGDLQSRGVPFAILCTHGDQLTDQRRRTLAKLPKMLRISGSGDENGGRGGAGGGGGPEALYYDGRDCGGYYQSASFYNPTSSDEDTLVGDLVRQTGGSSGIQPVPPHHLPQRRESTSSGAEVDDMALPEVIRIVTNYTRPLQTSIDDNESICEELETEAFPIPALALQNFPSAPLPPDVTLLTSKADPSIKVGPAAASNKNTPSSAIPSPTIEAETGGGGAGRKAKGLAVKKNAGDTMPTSGENFQQEDEWPRLPPLTDGETHEDVQQDIHILLVLIDALNKAEHFLHQRKTGDLPAPPVSQSAEECVIL